MSRQKEFLMIIFTLMAAFLVPINSTMISIALGSISDFYGLDIHSVTLVVTIYLIVMAVTQPIAGKLGDLYGNRKIYIIGILLFLAASIGCGLAPNIGMLVAFRSLQAIGGGLLIPNVVALIRQTVSRERLPGVLGFFGLGMGLGAAVGPLIGSLLIAVSSWKAIFLVNVPFLLGALAGGIFLLPKMQKKHSRQPLDVIGSIYLAVTITLLITLTHAESTTMYIVLGMGSLLFLGLFVRKERSVASPIIDFSLFKSPIFVNANLSVLINNFTMYAILLVMPLIMTTKMDISVSVSGVMLSLFSISMALSNMIGGQLNRKYSSEKVIFFSFAITVLTNLLFLFVIHIQSLMYLAVTLIVNGLAIGLGLTSMQVASLEAVEESASGSASGIFSTFRYFGSIISSTLIGIIANYSILFGILIVAAVLGAFLSKMVFRSNKNLSVDDNF
ncbi:MFS transporter [Bacillus sp. AFS017274]|uniref:MFS transporter n=1 Tax=Bacillus sp. AFS017274 TaxID=2033488 RepID=UPI000BF6B3F7|nr:MFS transporter [Bacillus sp. AFS017274]PEZ80198.1 MFS transporter [Bacillus sp. AFS017274]